MPHKTCIQCLTRPPAMETGRKCKTCISGNEAAYRARRKAAHVGVLVARVVWKEAGGRCEYCGIAVHRKRDKYDDRQTVAEIDHVLPVVLGGTGERSNLKLACKRCNREKDAQERSLYLAEASAA